MDKIASDEVTKDKRRYERGGEEKALGGEWTGEVDRTYGSAVVFNLFWLE